jgi:hypothetical protein
MTRGAHGRPFFYSTAVQSRVRFALSGLMRRRRNACVTELRAAVSAPLNAVSSFVVRRSAITLGKPLSTTFIRHSMSTPPRSPFTSRILTVTRSTTAPYLPNTVRVRRLISARSSSVSDAPSTLRLVGVIGTMR